MTGIQLPPLGYLRNYADSRAISNPGEQANILMLHGHGQSIDMFHHKTHFLQEALNSGGSQSNRSLPHFKLHYSEAPFDVNGPNMESKVWGYGIFDCQRIWGLEQSVKRVLKQLEHLNPVAGIIGFSTGATLAMIIASLLEERDRGLIFGVSTTHPPLKFVVAYSGFMLGHPMYSDLYHPRIRTPALLYIGEVDTMITPKSTYRLAKCCSHAEIQTFWGTHYVPRHLKTTNVAITFVCRCLIGEPEEENEQRSRSAPKTDELTLNKHQEPGKAFPAKAPRRRLRMRDATLAKKPAGSAKQGMAVTTRLTTRLV
ncbi:hypothetical protein AtubIFM56815_006111 [Aspergillus tubingensis]|uniref:Serine hydrolase domain-containing protein n=1 Tax=Aspergillus tubingensis TaxID=5068 RepID=A0A9W6AI14_ASPTU|nr:hypothetical protein AtubIFM56815_006111 [Aspergillus tubingensis]GLB18170.1 hypothetical protein AtubIFM61612_008061 [Aspergillus tubingensis]